MQYLVIAYDGTDADAPNRRLEARSAHLENARVMKQAGAFHDGGAILNEAGAMIGSALIVEFASEDELRSWLNDDPYVSGNVWQTIEVKPFRRAPL